MDLALPPVWDENELERERLRSIEQFVAERSRDGGEAYRAVLVDSLQRVEALFRATNDLLDFRGEILATDPGLTDQARYLGGPPLSADDLDTFSGMRIKGRRRLSADAAASAATVIGAALDRDRFPWLFDSRRRPTKVEREVAIKWTAGLQAAQRAQTGRRGESSARQEAAVEELLLALGFEKVSVKYMGVTTEFGRGQFARETRVGDSKCDIPIGLRDGRFLLIECKVSNSAVNSVKRLNRETVGKARHWKEMFGERAITGAVLSGVYKLANLKDAQTAGVALFWEHDLDRLAEFVQQAS